MKKIIKISLLSTALFLGTQTNGNAAFFNKQVPAIEVTTSSSSTNSTNVVKENEQSQTNVTSADHQVSKKISGGKSQLIALLLCIFLGGLGIHRFYLGYTGIGVIQLLTAGGFGVWFIIDLIRIITGDLKPKNGDYDKKL